MRWGKHSTNNENSSTSTPYINTKSRYIYDMSSYITNESNGRSERRFYVEIVAYNTEQTKTNKQKETIKQKQKREAVLLDKINNMNLIHTCTKTSRYKLKTLQTQTTDYDFVKRTLHFSNFALLRSEK